MSNYTSTGQPIRKEEVMERANRALASGQPQVHAQYVDRMIRETQDKRDDFAMRELHSQLKEIKSRM